MIFWIVVAILALILANGFFAAAEIALIAARKSRLQQLADEGDQGAKSALELTADPNRFLPTVQFGITLVGTFAAVVGGDQLVDPLAAQIAAIPVGFIANNARTIALVVVVASITFLSLLFGELVPKQLALRQAERFARVVGPFMSRLSKVARPFVWFLGRSTNAVLWRCAKESVEPSVSLDDIEHMIEAGTEEGVLESVEQRVALEALCLGDHKVRAVMRPRIDLDALDANTPSDEVIGAAAMAGFSRLPVSEGDLDHILGYVHIKDLFRNVYLGWSVELRKLLKPALFVPESMSLDRLLELFQEHNNQLAIVLDEYGGTAGMVTLEDVIEELVGEIREGHRHDREYMFVERDANSWLVDGSFAVSDLVKRLAIPVEEAGESQSFSTISGLILHELGRIPKVSDAIEWNSLRFEVVDMDGQRIDRVLVSRRETSTAA